VSQIWPNVFDFDTKTVSNFIVKLLRDSKDDRCEFLFTFFTFFRPLFICFDPQSMNDLRKYAGGEFWKAVSTTTSPVFLLFQAWGPVAKSECVEFLKDRNFVIIHSVDQNIQYKEPSILGDMMLKNACFFSCIYWSVWSIGRFDRSVRSVGSIGCSIGFGRTEFLFFNFFRIAIVTAWPLIFRRQKLKNVWYPPVISRIGENLIHWLRYFVIFLL
jgi:hypothetical protein